MPDESAVSKEGLDWCVAKLSLLRFFPSDPLFRAALVEELAHIAHSDQRLEWLAKRTMQLFQDWPGIHELRAVYSSRYTPIDGNSVDSVAYFHQDGIPAEPQTAPASKMLPAPRSKVDSLTADPEMREMIHQVSEAASFPALRRGDYSRSRQSPHQTSADEAAKSELKP